MFDNFPLWPVRASSEAGNVDALYIFLVALSAFMCVAIFAMILVFATKYRRRRGVEAEQIEGSSALEITWSIIPLGIFMAIFVWGAVIYFYERTPPRDAAEVYVVAKQWMWKLQHQEGPREINELHVPVGRNVKLIMTSQDVIHSFYVPAFRIKQDVLPGRYTVEWFRATKPGVYHLFCAEYCGTQHSGMVGSIVVLEPAQYEAWINGGSTGPLSATGEKIFAELGCVTCHRADVQGRGPNLQGVFGKPVQLEDGRTVTADENYLRECILDPGAKRVKGFQPIMPTFQGLVSEEQVNALVAYIKSISAMKPGAGAKTNASRVAPRDPNQIAAHAENGHADKGQADITAQAQPNGSQVQ
jgi:cytochrome c oxidase subunit 2